MVLINEQNEFIRNIITCTTKTQYVKGAIFNSTLYLFILSGILFEIDLSGKIDQNIICGFDSNSLKNNIDYITDDYFIFQEVYSKYEKIYLYKTGKTIFHNNTLREVPDFEQIITMKSADGACRYFVTTDTGINTFMTLYRGIFNLNKPDKIGMKIIEISQIDRLLLAEFNLFKKKINTNYNIYFIFMNFNQRSIL